MEDEKIVDLYWERSENALEETDIKYGKYCYRIAYNILYSNEDSEECVNDTYLKAWNAIPPQRPQRLSSFLGRITRNLALNRYSHNHAQKRSVNMELAYEEARDISSHMRGRAEDSLADEYALKTAINSFVSSLPKETRIIFVRRYWYLSPISDIARDYDIPEGTVKSILARTRKKFGEYLYKEGISL